MKRIVFQMMLLFSFELVRGQVPDTIVVEMNQVKGVGPFPLMLSPLQSIPDGSQWDKTLPEIRGLPSNLSDMLFCTEQADFLQFVYQNYYDDKISQELYESCQSAWRWKPDSLEFTKERVKGDIAILACKDSTGSVRVKVDRNNNYDLTDDEWLSIASSASEKNFFKRYNDSLLIDVAYELFNGKAIKKRKTWMYIDEAPGFGNSKQPSLWFTFAEHHQGEFTVNGIKYVLVLRAGRPTIRHDYHVKVRPATKEWDNEESRTDQGFAETEFLRLGDFHYKVVGASVDGSRVTLVLAKDPESLAGTQVGLKALPFTAQSIDGKTIDLVNEKGKYILLDFWGTWCAPCREEIPKLKDIYENHAGKRFLMIGVAFDKRQALESFVQNNGVKWPQILQGEDRQLLTLYRIKQYPTTFLIDPAGVIIAKDIRAVELEKMLKEILDTN